MIGNEQVFAVGCELVQSGNAQSLRSFTQHALQHRIDIGSLEILGVTKSLALIHDGLPRELGETPPQKRVRQRGIKKTFAAARKFSRTVHRALSSRI